MKLDSFRQYVPMDKEEVLAQAESEGVQFVALWFTDITGIVKSIVIPASELANVIDNGMHFDGSSIEGFGRVVESDMVLVPDLSTFTILPWNHAEERTARLICSVHTIDGEPFIGDPRNVLLRVMQQAENAGYLFKTGMELEYFLFYTDAYGKPVLDAPQDNANYFDITNEPAQSVHRRMVRTLLDLGIRVDSTHSENGNGQHEIGFQYNHALVSADNILTARVALKTIARQNNLHCTFMPRPLADQPGSGMHTHQSLHDVQTHANLFSDVEHPYGLSDTACHFLAGQLSHARAMVSVLAPLVNSYKRLGTSFEAPVYVTWAHVNRGALIRVPSVAKGKESHKRLEIRCPDPSANPYLATAVMLMSGLDGIRQKLALPEPLEETLVNHDRGRLRHVETLPASLGQALDALMHDDVVLSALGPYISDRYLAVKRQEYDTYNQQVTTWELDRYLDRY
jgi:glutamine synthetase